MIQRFKFYLLTAWYALKCVLYRPRRRKPNMLSSAASVGYIRRTHCSIGRYGDGEFNMVLNWLDGNGSRTSGFQDYDPSMGRRLYEILREGGNDADNFRVGIPGCMFRTGTSYLRKNARISWIHNTGAYFKRLYSIIQPGVRAGNVFLDSTFTRFYLSHRDKSHCAAHVAAMKQLWAGRDVIIVEGEHTRLGVGNDLFDGAARVRRILCPARNAWSRYGQILQSTLQLAQQQPVTVGGGKPLIIIALGMTATILARDLARAGHQALDMGHVDIEYMWMQMGATQKVPVPGKFTNEAAPGKFTNEAAAAAVADCPDPLYLSQIHTRVSP